MAKFLSHLAFEDEGGFPFRLLKPLIYTSLYSGQIFVPKGFKTDMASIPRLLWNLLPPIGTYDKAAVLHDFLYATAPHGMSRKEADVILNQAMEICGVGSFRRFIIYAGVRVGGWVPWNHYRHLENL